MIEARPIIEELSPRYAPEEIFQAFKDRRHSVFLDSGMSFKRLGRFSFITSDPFLVFKSKGKRIKISDNSHSEVFEGNPFNILKKYFYKYRIAQITELPTFIAGAVGYFAYDLGWQLERLPDAAKDDLGTDDMNLGFYDWSLIFDNLKRKTYISSTGLPETTGHMQRLLAKERIKEIKSRLCTIGNNNSKVLFENQGKTVERPALIPDFEKKYYIEAIEIIKRHIAAGDIYQANLSQRFSAKPAYEPYELYKRLRTINPAPFAAFLNLGEFIIASSSPEQFLKISGDGAITRPIKGTRPRGETAIEDEALKKELLSSKKDRAELVMIVDLERNDLGKVCDYGSIKVDRLIELESYATVFHLVSTVSGRLHKDKDHIDCIKACFPGGSITGAPKIRAMEILEGLEPIKRGLYTGSIGYLGFNQETNLNIVIRTMILKKDRVYFHVGGGIVADSVPEKEYDETMDKAKALINALSRAKELQVAR